MCVCTVFEKYFYTINYRIIEILQRAEHIAQLIEDFLDQAEGAVLYLSLSVLPRWAIEWREPGELLEKTLTTYLLKGTYVYKT